MGSNRDSMPHREVYFPALVDSVGFQRALDVLGVHPDTLKRWIKGRSPVPVMARAALWPLSYWGRQRELVMLENQIHTLQQLTEALQRENAALQAECTRLGELVDWGCANDPLPTRLMA